MVYILAKKLKKIYFEKVEKVSSFNGNYTEIHKKNANSDLNFRKINGKQYLL